MSPARRELMRMSSNFPPIFVSEQEAIAALDMRSAIEALDSAFRSQAKGLASNAPRFRTAPRGRGLNVTTARDESTRRFAVKIYGGGNFHILLYSADGGLLAVMEADWLGQMRTGAATALATRLLSPSNAGKVGLIGAGRQARAQLLALRAVDKLQSAAVFARDRGRLEEFCAKAEDELQAPVRAAASAREAVREAEIVVVATTSATPVLEFDWLKQGAHVNAMGANSAARRELAPAVVLNATMIVVDDLGQAKAEAAELIDLAAEARLDWSEVSSLSSLFEAGARARRAGSLTVFKSLGVGLEDLAIASLLYDRLAKR
jgi:alanine dehydrogenase